MSLSFDIQNLQDVTVFSFKGRLNNQEETESVLAKLDQFISENKKVFVFNLSDLEYITSSGLNFFIRSMTRIRNTEGELVFCSINTIIDKLFKISKLNEIFTITKTLEEGLAKFKINN